MMKSKLQKYPELLCDTNGAKDMTKQKEEAIMAFVGDEIDRLGLKTRAMNLQRKIHSLRSLKPPTKVYGQNSSRSNMQQI